MKLKYKLFDEAEGQQSAGAPAAATPQEPTAPVEDSVVDSSVDWVEMSDLAAEEPSSTDWGDSPAEPAEPQPGAQPAPTEPQQPAAEQAQEPVQPAPEAPEQLQQPQQFTPEQVQAAEAAYAAQLANLYQFDEETALKLQTEPEKVLPALAAKLHLDVMKTVMAQMRGMLPEMLQTQTKAVERENQAKTQFFTAWPELRGYEQQVLQVGRMYRQLNPNAPADEAVRRIGEVAMATLGLQRQQQQQQAPAQQQAFRPSVPGRVNPPSGPANPWAELIDDD